MTEQCRAILPRLLHGDEAAADRSADDARLRRSLLHRPALCRRPRTHLERRQHQGRPPPHRILDPRDPVWNALRPIVRPPTPLSPSFLVLTVPTQELDVRHLLEWCCDAPRLAGPAEPRHPRPWPRSHFRRRERSPLEWTMGDDRIWNARCPDDPRDAATTRQYGWRWRSVELWSGSSDADSDGSSEGQRDGYGSQDWRSDGSSDGRSEQCSGETRGRMGCARSARRRWSGTRAGRLISFLIYSPS